MLLLSKSTFKTLREAPNDADNRGTGYLVQAGFIRQELAGAYSYLPFGLRTLRKIETVVRKHLAALGAQEILMPALGSREHWLKTGRWDTVDVLFKVPASGNREYALNPTHEEVVTPLMGEFIRSYKDLDNCAVFQFQNKFRNEARAKSGILRGREFLMNDMYSFHRDEEGIDAFFERAREAYVAIFDELGLGADTYYTFASGGTFSKYSYEFQTELGIGEDDIYLCARCRQAHNKEIVDPENFVCAECGHIACEHKIASEVGNIFKLGTKFSQAFDLSYTDKEGKRGEILMGCYGIGVSRTMGVIAEKFSDDRGLVWPERVAPFTHVIIVLDGRMDEAKELAERLEAQGHDVLVDDREGGFGMKAADADLWGIPHRIVISNRTMEKNSYEYKARSSSESELRGF